MTKEQEVLKDLKKVTLEELDEAIKAVDKQEQEEAIEYFKKHIKYFEKILDVIKTYIRMIDENIEEILEQSKEIEELKEDNKKKSIVIIEYQDLYEKLVDKIKAKIEELDYNDIGNFERRCKQEVLQSLLEKE